MIGGPAFVGADGGGGMIGRNAQGCVMALAVIAFAGSGHAQTSDAPTIIKPGPDAGPLFIPCDSLPADAIKTLPPPLDQYASLVCTRSGQALKPTDGTQWVFDSGAMMLSATNPQSPSPGDHYTAIAFSPMSDADVTTLRTDMKTLNPEPDVLQRGILRFEVATSSGDHKQIYLLPPAKDAPKGAHVIGMECIHHCQPIGQDPWFFAIVPTP
jgi:hypothetical protein